MENVCPILFPNLTSSDGILYYSWFGKKRHMVRGLQCFLSEVIDIPCQFLGDPRH